MGLFSKINGGQKDTIISNLTKENKKLKIENTAYEQEIADLRRVSEDYQELMLKVTNLKKEYEKRLHTLDKLTESYQKELQHTINETKKRNASGK